jgi:hypothetical protein
MTRYHHNRRRERLLAGWTRGATRSGTTGSEHNHNDDNDNDNDNDEGKDTNAQARQARPVPPTAPQPQRRRLGEGPVKRRGNNNNNDGNRDDGLITSPSLRSMRGFFFLFLVLINIVAPLREWVGSLMYIIVKYPFEPYVN